MEPEALCQILTEMGVPLPDDKLAKVARAPVEKPNPRHAYDLMILHEPVLVITATSRHAFLARHKEAICYTLNGYHRKHPVKLILNSDGTVSAQILAFGQLPADEAQNLMELVVRQMNEVLPVLIKKFHT